MNEEKKRHAEKDEANSPNQVAGDNKEQVKQKTELLKEETIDRHEGKMDNGELGGGLRKEENT